VFSVVLVVVGLHTHSLHYIRVFDQRIVEVYIAFGQFLVIGVVKEFDYLHLAIEESGTVGAACFVHGLWPPAIAV
jgi:hypothetical protein